MSATVEGRGTGGCSCNLRSWEWIDNFLPDDIMQGDPRAIGSMWLYAGLDVLVLCLMLAPWSWSYLDKKPMRGGRLEKKGSAR